AVLHLETPGSTPGGDHEAVPTITPDEDARDRSIAAFRADLKAMMDVVADPETDLFAPIPHGQGRTILREALSVADHNAYNPGQLPTGRRLPGAWHDESAGRGDPGARARTPPGWPEAGRKPRGTGRTMIWAAPTARIGAGPNPLSRCLGGRSAEP